MKSNIRISSGYLAFVRQTKLSKYYSISYNSVTTIVLLATTSSSVCKRVHESKRPLNTEFLDVVLIHLI